LWEYETGGLVWSVAISSHGEYIAAGSWDHNVYLFSRDSGKPLWNYETRAGVKSVAISSDGQYIAVASYGGLDLFNRFSQEPLWSYSQYGAFNTVAVSSDGRYVAAGSSGDNSIVLFKQDGAVLWRNPIGGEPLSVAISSDGEYVVAGSEGSAYSVHVFNRDKGPLWTYRVGAAVESVAISSDNQYIIAGSDDQMIHMFRRDNQTPLWSHHFESIVWSVGLSSNGQSVAVGAAGSVYIFAVSLSWTLFLAEMLIAIGLSAVAIFLARKQLRVARYLWGCLNRRSFRAGLAGTLASAGFVSALSASIWRMIIAALGITVMLTVGLTLVFCPFIILLLSRRKPLHSAVSCGLGIVLAIGVTCAAISVLALVGAI